MLDMLNMLENPVPWPNGARCAASITFDMDTDSALHLSHADAYKRVAALSWLRYDEVAVPRIVKLFNHYNIKGTFFVPGWCVERYPATVETIVASDHELAYHGYLHENPMDQTREGERYWLERSIEAIERLSGKRPVGGRAPYYNYSPHSTGLLAQAGFVYDSSLMADSQPYVMRAPEGEVIELPTDWAMDDWPQYAHSPDFHYLMPTRAPDKAMEVFMAEFEAGLCLRRPVGHGLASVCDRAAGPPRPGRKDDRRAAKPGRRVVCQHGGNRPARAALYRGRELHAARCFHALL